MENVRLINVSLNMDWESCFTSFTHKRFRERCENTDKSSLQKYTYIIWAQLPTCLLVFLITYVTYHFFYSHGREEKETGGREYIMIRRVDPSKTKLWTKKDYNEIHKRRPQRLFRV